MLGDDGTILQHVTLVTYQHEATPTAHVGYII